MKAKAYIVHRVMREPELEWGKPKDCLSAEPLYTTPPKRKPLTDEMLDDIYYCVEGGRNELETWRQQARAVEAAHGIKGD